MKKLMIAFAAVAVAACAQAAGYKWSSAMTGGVLYDGTTTGKATGINLYLFMDGSQDAVFTALKNGTDITTLGAFKTTKTDASTAKITALTWSDGATGTHDFFFAAIIDDGKFYISNEKQNIEYLTSGTGAIQYGDLTSTSQSIKDVAGGFVGAGVYQVAAVPEPTSAMLLLLGVGVMALRRKRA